MKRLNPNTGIPFKRGDLDAKGNYFCCYVKNKKLVGGFYFEKWVSQEAINEFRKSAENGAEKKCSKCGVIKSLKDGFYEKLHGRDGYEPTCKSCFLEKNKRWLKDNLDRHSELTARWYEQNKEKHLENSKKFYSSNKKRKLVDYYRREERTNRATPDWVAKNELIAIFKEAENLSSERGEPFEVDHIVPLYHKQVCGLNVPWNLQIISRTANRRKGNKFAVG